MAVSILVMGCTIQQQDNNGEPESPPAESPTEESKSVPEDNYKDELQIKAEEILNSMTLEEKAGQLIIVGFPQGTEDGVIKDYIDRYRVGGFILFKRNYTDFKSLYNLSSKLKEWNRSKNPLPLFIAADEEGGTVSRLPKGGTRFPDAQVLGKINDIGLTEKTGEVIGEEFKAAGLNLDFAPVLDIVNSPDNKLLIKRSYGSTPEVVSSHGTAFINGLQSRGVIAAPKHFPGHGATNVDSHGKLPVISIDRDTLYSRELVPFINAISGNLDALMVGHLSFPKIDASGLPATMSGFFLTDLLRKELGFQGVAISDEIEMYGYLAGKPSLEECVMASFNSGLDIFVIGHTKDIQDRVLNTLLTGIKNGEISEERLNESVLRIIKLKLKYNLEDRMPYDFEEAQNYFGSNEHKEVLNTINERIKGR